jgi:serine/threonine protein kinase
MDSHYICGIKGIAKLEDDLCFMILEYCQGGNLSHFLEKNQTKFSLKLCLHFTLDILNGIRVLFERNILHRDLKSLNILIATDNNKLQCKIGDFGTSVLLDKRETLNDKNMSLRKMKGTYSHLAPEFWLESKSRATHFSDIYSFGVVLWEMFNTIAQSTYSYPYSELDNNMYQVYYQVCTGLRPIVKKNTPVLFLDIFLSCIETDPTKRPNVITILNEVCSPD